MIVLLSKMSTKTNESGFMFVACTGNHLIAHKAPGLSVITRRRLGGHAGRQTRGFVFMSTSKLQRYVSSLLSTHLGGNTIRENYRPDWMTGPTGWPLELDFYIEELSIAIEVQGAQHFQFVEHFHHEYSQFEKRQEFDALKKRICRKRGIELVEIFDEIGALRFVEKFYFTPDENESTIERPSLTVQDFESWQAVKDCRQHINNAFNMMKIVEQSKRKRRTLDRLFTKRCRIAKLIARRHPDIVRLSGEGKLTYFIQALKLIDDFMESHEYKPHCAKATKD